MHELYPLPKAVTTQRALLFPCMGLVACRLKKNINSFSCLNCSITEAAQPFHLSDTFSYVASGLYEHRDAPKTSPRVFPKSARHAATARVPAVTPARCQSRPRERHMAARPHGSVPATLLPPCPSPAPRVNHRPRTARPQKTSAHPPAEIKSCFPNPLIQRHPSPPEGGLN